MKCYPCDTSDVAPMSAIQSFYLHYLEHKALKRYKRGKGIKLRPLPEFITDNILEIEQDGYTFRFTTDDRSPFGLGINVISGIINT